MQYVNCIEYSVLSRASVLKVSLVDGWAGATNTHPHPNSPPAVMGVFALSNLLITYGTTNQQTNRWTDKASFRIASPRPKNQNGYRANTSWGRKEYKDSKEEAECSFSLSFFSLLFSR